MSWLRSALYLEWAYRVDLAGIMYYDRVGDAPLRTLAVAMLLGDDQVRSTAPCCHGWGMDLRGGMSC